MFVFCFRDISSLYNSNRYIHSCIRTKFFKAFAVISSEIAIKRYIFLIVINKDFNPSFTPALIFFLITVFHRVSLCWGSQHLTKVITEFHCITLPSSHSSASLSHIRNYSKTFYLVHYQLNPADLILWQIDQESCP